ncbi:MAG: hypothetical protein ACRD2W_20255 [Acidimicrobiales bacterium]
MKADGTGQRVLFPLSNAGWDSCPRVAPDGTRAAMRRVEPWTTFDGIWLVSLADARATEVPLPVPAASLHHHGRILRGEADAESRNRVGYVSWERGYFGIFVASADRSDLRLVTPIPPDVDPWRWDATHPSRAI